MAHRFGEEFEAALLKAGMGRREFARRARCADSLPSKVIKGQRTPPLEQIDPWCAILRLQGPDRDRFRLYALLAHAPAELTLLVEDLIAQVNQRGRPARLHLPAQVESPARAAEPRTDYAEEPPARPRRR